MDPLLVQLTTTLAPSMNTTDITTNHNNTTTFLIGFGILLVFVVFGVLASAFLCLTLKKDAYLWEAEQPQGQLDQAQHGQGSVSIVVQLAEDNEKYQKQDDGGNDDEGKMSGILQEGMDEAYKSGEGFTKDSLGALDDIIDTI